jgi:uncharacterized protein YuzE
MAKFEIDYDEEFDDLFVYRKDKKAELSVNLGNFVIDATKNGQIVGIEVMEASSTLSDFIGTNITKSSLEKLEDATIHVNPKDNAIELALILRPKNQEEKRVPMLLPAISA